MQVDVKQLKYIKIYSRWWIRERSTYGYEVGFVVFDDLKIIDAGKETYPQLCSLIFSNTYRPHLLAIDCFLSSYLLSVLADPKGSAFMQLGHKRSPRRTLFYL